jgi:hypothetical protein
VQCVNWRCRAWWHARPWMVSPGDEPGDDWQHDGQDHHAECQPRAHDEQDEPDDHSSESPATVPASPSCRVNGRADHRVLGSSDRMPGGVGRPAYLLDRRRGNRIPDRPRWVHGLTHWSRCRPAYRLADCPSSESQVPPGLLTTWHLCDGRPAASDGVPITPGQSSMSRSKMMLRALLCGPGANSSSWPQRPTDGNLRLCGCSAHPPLMR